MLPATRSHQFTVTIPCVMHPHYKISRRTEMLPARESTSIHELEPYLCVMVPCTTRYHRRTEMLPARFHVNSRAGTIPVRHASTLVMIPHTHTHASSSRSLSIHSNHTLRHAPSTTRYHDAQKCFQLAFTSIHSNHTLRACTHRYKIPRRTQMLPARVHINSQ